MQKNELTDAAKENCPTFPVPRVLATYGVVINGTISANIWYARLYI
jgi:streptogramin lyase